MHWLAKAAIAVISATVLSSCSTASSSTPSSSASGNGPEVIVLRPVDGEGKLAAEWNVRPVRGNAEMSCVTAKPSPYAVDAGVVTGCSPNPDSTLACWIIEKNPGTICLTTPFDPSNRLVVQFPTASHGTPAAPPASPVPVALELEEGTLCSPVDESRYRCGTVSDVIADPTGRWKAVTGKHQVVKAYFLGVAQDRAALALAIGPLPRW